MEDQIDLIAAVATAEKVALETASHAPVAEHRPIPSTSHPPNVLSTSVSPTCSGVVLSPIINLHPEAPQIIPHSHTLVTPNGGTASPPAQALLNRSNSQHINNHWMNPMEGMGNYSISHINANDHNHNGIRSERNNNMTGMVSVRAGHHVEQASPFDYIPGYAVMSPMCHPAIPSSSFGFTPASGNQHFMYAQSARCPSFGITDPFAADWLSLGHHSHRNATAQYLNIGNMSAKTRPASPPNGVDPPKFPPMEQPLDNDHPTDQEMNGTGTSLPKSLINQERQIAITEADTNNAQNNTKCHDDASTSPPPDSNCLINHEPSDRTVPSGPPSDSMGHPSLWNTTTPVHHGPSLDWSDTVAPSSWPGAVMNSIDPSGRYFCTTPAPGVPGASPSPGMTGGVSLPPLAFSPSPFGQKFPGSLPPANTPGALSVFRGGVTPGSSSLFWLLSGHGGSNHDELGMLDQTPAMGSVPSVSGPGDEGLNFFSPWKNLQSLPEVRPLETSPSVTPVPNPNDKDALISASSIDLPACALGEDPSGDPGAFGHRLDARRGSPSIVSNDLAAKSLGSINHPHDCRPCAFYWTKGCINGHDCRFCHLWHPPKKKKPMKEQKNLMIIARPDGKIEFMRCTVCEAMRVL